MLHSWLFLSFSYAVTYWVQTGSNEPRCYWTDASPGTMVHAGVGPGTDISAIVGNDNNINQVVYMEITENLVDDLSSRRIVHSYNGTENNEIRFETTNERNATMVRVQICVWQTNNLSPAASLRVPIKVVFDVGPEAGDHSRIVGTDTVDKLSEEIHFQHKKVRSLNKEMSDLRHRDFTAESTTESIYTWIKWLCIANIGFLVTLGIVEVVSFRFFLKKKKII